MKRKTCLVLSAMMLAGVVPVSAAESQFEMVKNTYTAEAGTTKFAKNGELQPLDANIYIKEDYVMLPLRTFMKAVDPSADMTWDDKTKTAKVEFDGEDFLFDIAKNELYYGKKEMRVYGQMEISQDRIFVPIRNWKSILETCDYIVNSDDINWDDKTKTATVIVKKEEKIKKEHETDYSTVGNPPVFTLNLSNKYDEIQNIGNGLFIAEKYMEEDMGLGQGLSSPENEYYLIDSTGKVYLQYESNSIRNLQSLNDGLFLVKSKDRSKLDQVIDKDGTVIFESPYDFINPFYDGLAQVSSDGLTGFVDKKGNLVIPLQYEYAEDFSEGFAAICVGVNLEDKTAKWNYIDRNGDFINDNQYRNCQSFSKSMGKVITADGTGYIDKSGNEVIKPQYKWGSPFVNNFAYVQDKNTNEIWFINKAGEKIKMITKVNDEAYIDIDKNSGILIIEEIIDLPDGDHQHKQTYYNAYGKVTAEEYRIQKNESEDYYPVYVDKEDKYGYASNGYWKIPALFDEVESFKDGYAVVRNGIKLSNGEEDVEWGIIKVPK